MTTKQKQKDRVSAAISARGAAIRELVNLHADDFDRIYGDAREANGLPRVPFQGDNPENLKAKIARHEDMISKWEAQLAMYNGAAH